MSDQPLSRDVTIINPRGFHARPAHVFVGMANSFNADIKISNDREKVDGKSILSILTLGAEQGTSLTIYATGSDAREALDALAELVNQGFDSEELDDDEPPDPDSSGEDQDRLAKPSNPSP